MSTSMQRSVVEQVRWGGILLETGVPMVRPKPTIATITEIRTEGVMKMKQSIPTVEWHYELYICYPWY